MQKKEPRSIRGLVQTRDMADFMGVPEATIRAWRKRHHDWEASGRKATASIHAHFPKAVSDELNPDVPFLINGGPVYDEAAVVSFRDHLEQHERKAGNPAWTRAAETA